MSNRAAFSPLAQLVRRTATTALICLLGSAPPALAQLSRVGTNPDLGAVPVRGTDTAYDPVNDIYLVVGSTAGNTMTPLFGVFSNTAGDPIAAPFQVNDGGLLAHFPRVIYSPDLSNGAGGFGAFLVTWHGGLFTNSVHARVVAYPNRIVSADTTIPSQTFQEAGPSVAYSPSSHVFLVTWQASDFTVWGAILGMSAQLVGGPFQISDVGIGARDPSVAWNPSNNEFGVLYSGFSGAGATTTFARVNPSGSVLRRNTFNVTTGTYITDLAFNTSTGRYLAAWFQGGVYGAEIDANGDAIAQGLLSTTTGTRDGLGVAYNQATGTFLLVGMGPSFNIWAAELNSRGARTSGDTEITSAGGPLGSYHPRTTAHKTAADWNVSFYHNFGTMRDQVVRTSSRSGGPAGSLGSAPPPTSGGGGTSTGGCTTPDPFAAIGGGTCINGGWVYSGGGGGTTGGTSGGCTTPSPGTGWTCVNGGWVPPTSSGGTSGGCTTPDPFAAIGGGTCVNGGWIPGTSGGSTSGGTSGGCTTPSPGTGWTCINGGWVPPTSSGGTSGGCTTPDPFTAIGGGTCVNGGWIPGGSGGGTSSGGCTTPSPGSGWVCVNGGWIPGVSTSSTSGGCTTPDPFAAIGGGTCVNGGWVPGTSGSTSGGCTTPDPFVALGGGICSNGGWTLASSSSTCSTPDPFTAIGGGVCINGGWVPK
jgi:hypothetical protein